MGLTIFHSNAARLWGGLLGVRGWMNSPNAEGSKGRIKLGSNVNLVRHLRIGTAGGRSVGGLPVRLIPNGLQ